MCPWLDGWLDEESKKIDAKEQETKRCFVTGERK